MKDVVEDESADDAAERLVGTARDKDRLTALKQALDTARVNELQRSN